MEFTISKDEVKKLDALVKMASSVADISIQKNLYILKAESDKLKAIVYGNGNVIEFEVSIGNIVASGSNYFYINISEFIETAEKVFLSSGQDIVKVSVQTNKLNRTIFMGGDCKKIKISCSETISANIIPLSILHLSSRITLIIQSISFSEGAFYLVEWTLSY